jgi:hypothetical protein
MNNFQKFGKTESWQRGQDVESRFFELFKKHRDNCRKASLDEQFDHTDIICGDMKIDVKSMKRVKRSSRIQDEFTWIEFKNTAGMEGWIFGSGTHIAFEIPKGFILVKKKDLAQMALTKCDLTTLVTSPNDALYKGYSRPNRKDLISIVRMQDIFDLSHEFIPLDDDII